MKTTQDISDQDEWVDLSLPIKTHAGHSNDDSERRHENNKPIRAAELKTTGPLYEKHVSYFIFFLGAAILAVELAVLAYLVGALVTRAITLLATVSVPALTITFVFALFLGWVLAVIALTFRVTLFSLMHAVLIFLIKTVMRDCRHCCYLVFNHKPRRILSLVTFGNSLFFRGSLRVCPKLKEHLSSATHFYATAFSPFVQRGITVAIRAPKSIFNGLVGKLGDMPPRPAD